MAKLTLINLNFVELVEKEVDILELTLYLTSGKEVVNTYDAIEDLERHYALILEAISLRIITTNSNI